ncbi:MAG TPA: hypothetical protein V6D17_24815, partial [Candidatus Obscuribacterales bacterium]
TYKSSWLFPPFSSYFHKCMTVQERQGRQFSATAKTSFAAVEPLIMCDESLVAAVRVIISPSKSTAPHASREIVESLSNGLNWRIHFARPPLDTRQKAQ